MKKSIFGLEAGNCCGCLSCKAVCSYKAIRIIEDNEHFLCPSVDESKCRNCGKCSMVCPEKNPAINNNRKTRVFSAFAQNEEIRKKGSSGSIFYLLAEKIIEKKGIVYGATMLNLKVEHIKITEKQDIEKLCKSKYVQSNMEKIWPEIISDIQDNKLVMFVGTPCQVMALNNIFPKRRDNLLLVDFICHGTPNQWLFDRNIEYLEKKKGIRILDYEFRTKSTEFSGVHGVKYRYQKEGRQFSEILSYKADVFYFNFREKNIYRNSCYDCRFASADRISDITLGDFWGAEKIEPESDLKKGVSIVCSHTDLGSGYLSALGKNINKEYNEDLVIRTNHSYSKKTRIPKARRTIYYDAEKMTPGKWGSKYGYRRVRFYFGRIMNRARRLTSLSK